MERKCKWCKEKLKWYEGWFSKLHSHCKFIEGYNKFAKAFALRGSDN